MLKSRKKESTTQVANATLNNNNHCNNQARDSSLAAIARSAPIMGALDGQMILMDSNCNSNKQNSNANSNETQNNSNTIANINETCNKNNIISNRKSDNSAAGFIAQPFANFHLKCSPFGNHNQQQPAIQKNNNNNNNNLISDKNISTKNNFHSLWTGQQQATPLLAHSALNMLGHNYETTNNNNQNSQINHDNQHKEQQQFSKLNSKLKPANSFHSKAKKLLNLSTPTPLRPSSSTSCLFSSLTSEDSSDSTSSLASMPTRASLTHEWKKLKTPNKCRECNLLVYFNGRECSFCGFVAHKKCATILVIKCSGQRVMSGNQSSIAKSVTNSMQSNATSQSTSPTTFTSTGLSWSRKKSEKKQNNCNIMQNDNKNHDKHSSWPCYGQSQSQCSLGSQLNSTTNTNLNTTSINANPNANPNTNSNVTTKSQATTTTKSNNIINNNNNHKQTSNYHQPIYGRPILFDSHQIVEFIRRFVYEIDSRGLTSKGIYRVSSIKSKVDKLCNYYDQNLSSLVDLSSFHPNIIANAFKMYLRQLPEPLLTDNLYCKFIEIAKKYPLDKTQAPTTAPVQQAMQQLTSAKSNQQLATGSSNDSTTNLSRNLVENEYCQQRRASKLYSPPLSLTQLTMPNNSNNLNTTTSSSGQHHLRGASISMTNLNDTSVFSPAYDPMLIVELREIIDLLPPINKELIAIIMRHLKRVADMSDSNQMSAKNLSIIFGPTLLNTRDKSIAIVDSIHQARVVELMILWAEQIFPLYSNYESNAVIELNMPYDVAFDHDKSDIDDDDNDDATNRNINQRQARAARYSCSFDENYQTNNANSPINVNNNNNNNNNSNNDTETKSNNDNLTQMVIYVDLPKVDITLCDEIEDGHNSDATLMQK